MLRLLRSVRRRLVTDSDSKARGFLLYALGEIVLVVIGILIALQIGEWQEGREQEARVEEILRQVQGDLIADVRRLELMLRHGALHDSLTTLVMGGRLTAADYEAALPVDLNGPFWIGLRTEHFNARTTGWDRLLALQGEFPARFHDVRTTLEAHYRENGSFLQLAVTAAREQAVERHRTLAAEQPWHWRLRTPAPPTPEMLEWYLEAPRYRNWVGFQIDELRPGRMGDLFQASALAAWVAIARELGDPVDHPLVPEGLVAYDGEEWAPWVGEWRLPNGVTMRVLLSGGLLHMEGDGGSFAIPLVRNPDGSFQHAARTGEIAWWLERGDDGAPQIRLAGFDGAESTIIRRVDDR